MELALAGNRAGRAPMPPTGRRPGGPAPGFPRQIAAVRAPPLPRARFMKSSCWWTVMQDLGVPYSTRRCTQRKSSLVLAWPFCLPRGPFSYLRSARGSWGPCAGRGSRRGRPCRHSCLTRSLSGRAQLAFRVAVGLAAEVSLADPVSAPRTSCSSRRSP